MLLIFAVLVVVIFMNWRYLIWRRNRCQLLPGNKQSFFNCFGDVGGLTIYYLLLERSSKKPVPHLKVMEVLREYVVQFRESPFFCAWFACMPLVIIVKAEAVEQLLKSNQSNDKSSFYKFLDPVLGSSSLLTSSGAKWKSKRRLLNPCFHADILRGFMDIINERSQDLVNLLRGETAKEFTDTSTPIILCTLDILCESVLGVETGALKNENSEYVMAMKRSFDIAMTRVFAFWQWPDFLFWLTESGREFRHHTKVLNDFSRSIIRQRKMLYLSEGKGGIKGKRKSLVDVLLEQHFETKELSEEDIRQEVDTFIIAGHETVANSLNWALYLIGLYPDIQNKIHEELDRIFGDDVRSSISEDNLKELSYLDCVLKEALRLFPPAPFFARQSEEDTKICDYEIPKGTHIAAVLYFLHRDPTVFPDPEKFNPERFFPENCINRNPYAYIPFSAGPRNCIGQKLAVMEMKTIVALILRNYTLESLDEREKVPPIMDIFLVPSSPLRIRIRCRRKENP